jgi:hypothetical protein
MDHLNNREKKLEELKKQAEQLTKQITELTNLPDNKKLAIDLHDSFCTCDHPDGCNWFWEMHSDTNIHDWEGQEHKTYLNKSNSLLDTGLDMLTIREILSILSK